MEFGNIVMSALQKNTHACSLLASVQKYYLTLNKISLKPNKIWKQDVYIPCGILYRYVHSLKTNNQGRK